MKSLFAILCLATLFLGAAPAEAPSPRPPAPTIQEILSMIEAGIGERVILQMIAGRGAPAAVSVAELLALRSAGASDALLEALATGSRPASALSTGSPTTPPGLRAWVEVDENGVSILHVTNLDAEGRRLGGELSAPERARLAAGSSQRDPRHEKVPSEAAPSPVIVNVYTQPGPENGNPGDAGWIGSYPVSGRHPGLWFRPHCHGSPRPSVPREEFFGRPRIIDTAPYRAATAAQRNRATFRD